MKIRTIATPLTTASFLTVAVTGLFMLFHLSAGLIRPLHEIASLLFVIGSILHIILHWGALVQLLKKPGNLFLIILFSAITLFAIFVPTGNHYPPFHESFSALMQADITTVAKLTGQTSESITQKLTAQGYTIPNPNATINEIAQQNNKETAEVLNIALSGFKPVR